MLGRLVAILPFSPRTDRQNGPAKIIDGDAIVVSEQLVRLHGIDAPGQDQTLWGRGEQRACGTMSLAALEALIAGVKFAVRWSGGMVAKVFSPNGGRHRPEIGVVGVGHWGIRWTMSPPRPGRPSAGCGGELS